MYSSYQINGYAISAQIIKIKLVKFCLAGNKISYTHQTPLIYVFNVSLSKNWKLFTIYPNCYIQLFWSKTAQTFDSSR